MSKFKKIFSIVSPLLLCVSLSGCLMSSTTIKPKKIIDIRKAVSPNGNQFETIIFGNSLEDSCELSFLSKDLLKSGTITSNNNSNLSAFCDWNGVNYIQSNKYNTEVKITFSQQTDKEQLIVDLKLIGTSNKKFLNLVQYPITIERSSN